ncbi:MAG: alpha/beta hydrolase [Gammaproteobacteria bacterium]|nr:alpha/beta hydrolase [Gammaproteobacteria bacterium]
MIYSKYGYRINQISHAPGYNWLFLPGGPGLGSEYLIAHCKKLKLPGTITVLDFPKDGTNEQGILGIQHWQEGLVDLLKNFHRPILVTHSFSGMLVLSMPDIEKHLAGLVLMNTTTVNSFFEHVSAMRDKHQLPDLLPAASAYHLNPSNQTYREFWDTYKYYCFTADEMAEGEKIIPLFAFNNESYHYAITHFFMNYSCKWHPTTIPLMTITSENDFICPPLIFKQDKRFQSHNVINKVIIKAGHCPWLIYFDAVQECFNEYIEKLNSPDISH